MKKLSFLLILIGCFFISISKASGEVTLASNAKSAILIEASTNTILYDKNKDTPLAMASMTKVMTLSLIYDAIENGTITMDTEIVCSEHAQSMGGSQVYLEVGEKHPLKEMIKCIALASANDCAVAVSEAIYGSENEAVNQMNNKAKELHMDNTHYMDVTGLTSDNHYTSAYDMAVIASYLVNKHPQVLEYTSMREGYIREDTPNPFWLVNTNKLIGHVEGVDGLKTGWTEKAGYCITTTMKKNNMRLISVVMGYSNPVVRNSESVELLNYGFATYKLQSLIEKGSIVYEMDDILYKPSNFKMVTLNDIQIVVKKGEQLKEISYHLVQEPDISKNQKGILEVLYDGEVVGQVEFYSEVELIKKNFFELFIDIIRKIFID